MAERIVVVGASRIGCQFAMAAQAAGHHVVLVDEHPQSLKDMSLDAPYFYGAGLPAALSNANAVAQAYLEASPEIVACVEAGVDVRLSTVLWGAFRNSENSLHIGTPKAGLVTRDGNELIEHDTLVIAAGVRDFVPSFWGWELPGVLGAKAALTLLDRYGVFEGKGVLVLGSSEVAMRLVRSLLARQIPVVGIVEPGDQIEAGSDAWLAQEGIPVYRRSVIRSADGTVAVQGATIVSTDGRHVLEVSCDTIAVGIATLPNVELAAAMGCDLGFDEHQATWVPRISAHAETSCAGVFYLPPASDPSIVEHVLAQLSGAPAESPGSLSAAGENAGASIRRWIKALHDVGGSDVVLCQCEAVTRGQFCGLEPPRYLDGALRSAQTPKNTTDMPQAPRLNQDMVKRMTRVGMGHCQGKRCRDEAAFTLMQRFDVRPDQLRPASYRFPLRPIDVALIAADDETDEIRLNWQMWPYETRNA